jgi:hypothetical protein
MALQSDRLTMVALSVFGDNPPNQLQPRLANGIHLRWAFARDVGFPWSGYYFFRRKHDPQKLTQYQACLGKDLVALENAIHFRTSPFLFAGGELSSKVDLKLTGLWSGDQVKVSIWIARESGSPLRMEIRSGARVLRFAFERAAKRDSRIFR